MSVFLERQKVRREKKMKQVMRRVERFLRSAAIVLGGLVVMYGGYGLVFYTPYLAMHDIVVTSEGGHVTATEVTKLSDVPVGRNLFSIDVSDVQRRLHQSPWVRASAVRRHLPHTLWIYVEEYVPVAIVACDKLFYIDREGNLFKEVTPSDDKGYPVLTGMISDKVSHDSNGLPLFREEERHRSMTAIDVAQWFSHSNLVETPVVSEVHFDPVRGYSLVTARKPLHLILGLEDVEARMEKIDQLSLAIRQRSAGRIQYVIADGEDRVIVKYSTS